MNLDTLKEVASRLPDAVKANAETLLAEMSSVVEGIGDEPVAWKPPFLKLVQSTTDRTTLPKGTGVGDFVVGEKALDKTLKYIPLRIWDARQYWDPDQNNNRMLCNSPDAKKGYIGLDCKQCPHSQWKDEGGSDCNKIKGMLAITSDLRTIFNINFAKSSYKAGTELEGFMKKAGVSPYRRTYGMNTTPSATAKNVEIFKNEILSGGEQVTPEAHIEFLTGLFNIIQADRKAMIDRFYEMAAVRTATAAALPPPESYSTLVIENSPTETTADATADIPEKKSKVSPLAKNYTV